MGDPLEESKSAKRPGRPQFSAMMSAIAAGEADGIVCWHLDRLARNPLDGGQIMWALSQGVIKEIVTPGATYTGAGDHRLLMSIIFGMATKYSDDLGANVRRGQRESLKQGRWPSQPKVGYIRDPETGETVPDPERFAIVQELWRMRLKGAAIGDLVAHARDVRSLRLRRRGRVGGRPMSMSHMYRLFHDSFYAGLMVFGDQAEPGNHKPMVSWSEFERVQAMFQDPAGTDPGSTPTSWQP